MFRSLVTLGAVAAVASATDFTTCDDNKLGINAVDVNPDPVVAGKDLSVAMSGTSTVAVSGGNAELKVKVMGITIATEKFDLCNDLNVACPLAANADFKGSIVYPIPSQAPGGVTATAEIDFVDSSSNKVGCIDLKLKVTKATELASDDEMKFLFDSWRAQFDMEFDDEEYEDRFGIFKENHERIVSHNTDLGATYTMAHNQFSHMTAYEFKSRMTGYVPAMSGASAVFESTNATVADSVDWTSKGAVTGVKDQGQCGSCWSFSTTGSVEGAYFLSKGTLLSLSEQQLVDCDTQDSGCNGGLMDYAFQYIEKNGLASEGDYAYTGKDGSCSASSKTMAIGAGVVSGYTDVTSGDEDALKQAVAQQPVAVAIEADQLAFQFYSKGVMTGKCGHKLDHGVLAVGYGTDGGKDYWKVKNSWGGSWGESGYIRMERGSGKCGIADQASFPTVK